MRKHIKITNKRPIYVDMKTRVGPNAPGYRWRYFTHPFPERAEIKGRIDDFVRNKLNVIE